MVKHIAWLIHSPPWRCPLVDLNASVRPTVKWPSLREYPMARGDSL